MSDPINNQQPPPIPPANIRRMSPAEQRVEPQRTVGLQTVDEMGGVVEIAQEEQIPPPVTDEARLKKPPEPNKPQFVSHEDRNANNKEDMTAPADLTDKTKSDPLAKHYYFPMSKVKLEGIKTASDAVVEFPDGGTGFIVHKDGYIVTNNHVAKQLLNDNQQIDESRSIFTGSLERISLEGAKIIDSDKSKAIALIYIPALKGRAVVQISDKLPEADQTLFLIGHPDVMDGQRTVSVGSVNELPSDNREKIIVTDNETRSGNSGGPLVDDNGRVYGIVYASLTVGGFTSKASISPSANIVSIMKKNNLLPQK